MKQRERMCEKCNTVVDVMLKENAGVEPKEQYNRVWMEFDELTGSWRCHEWLVCMPRRRIFEKLYSRP